MRSFYAISLLLFTTSIQSADSCAKGFILCSPPGATSSLTPHIGDPSFQQLFINIVQSSLPSSSQKRAAGTTSLCCNALLSCMSMSQLELPFCYDRFTTNYFLPDGSFGTVVGGAYTSAIGDTANLETGEYTLANGQRGNIYPDGAGKPDTATLPMPSQFTGTGVGSAVPASSLGNAITITYTTTLPGTTRAGFTLPASTVASVSEQTVLVTSTVFGIAGTVTSTLEVPISVTIEGSTTEGSTFAGSTMTVTTTTQPAVATTTKKSAAERMAGGNWGLVVLSLLVIR